MGDIREQLNEEAEDKMAAELAELAESFSVKKGVAKLSIADIHVAEDAGAFSIE